MDPVRPLQCPSERARRAVVADFVWRRFGPAGALRLHGAAIGLDLLRAPLNVALAPVFLLVRLTAALAGLLHLRRAAAWLVQRRILLRTSVARRVEADLHDFLGDLAARGLGVSAPAAAVDEVIADYVGVRSAIAEITTALFVAVAGFAIFHDLTPGIISLAAPFSQMMGHAAAVAQFPLGDRLGVVWYGLFPVELPVSLVILTGVALAILGALVTTFAGIVADPLQAALGIHQRRLRQLLRRLDESKPSRPAVAGEHLFARVADLGDLFLALVRALRP